MLCFSSYRYIPSCPVDYCAPATRLGQLGRYPTRGPCPSVRQAISIRSLKHVALLRLQYSFGPGPHLAKAPVSQPRNYGREVGAWRTSSRATAAHLVCAA